MMPPSPINSSILFTVANVHMMFAGEGAMGPGLLDELLVDVPEATPEAQAAEGTPDAEVVEGAGTPEVDAAEGTPAAA